MSDTEEFEAERRESVRRLGADRELRKTAIDLFARADRHNWSYQWSWLGVPVIQIPTDIVATQELVWDAKPDLIIETGIARGGSLVFFASLLQLLGRGTVLGIDVDIRPHNRQVIEEHPLAHRIRLLEGSSVDTAIVEEAGLHAASAERVMVILDSDHTHAHVAAELVAYAPLVTPGQYIIVADTIIEEIPEQVHRPRAWGPGDNPATAVAEFLPAHPEFELDQFLSSKLLLSSSAIGYLRRRG